MAIVESLRQKVHRSLKGTGARHWFHEQGVPGWAGVRGGYPCLHWSEMEQWTPYDRDQEIALLLEEAEELEMLLRDVRERIAELARR